MVQSFLLYKWSGQGEFYKCFLLMYNKALPAVASVGVLSIEYFGRLIILLGDCVFKIPDSVIPMKSNSGFISSKKTSKIITVFERN